MGKVVTVLPQQVVLIAAEVTFHVGKNHGDIPGGEVSVTDHYGGSTNAWKRNKKTLSYTGSSAFRLRSRVPLRLYTFTQRQDTLNNV